MVIAHEKQLEIADYFRKFDKGPINWRVMTDFHILCNSLDTPYFNQNGRH